MTLLLRALKRSLGLREKMRIAADQRRATLCTGAPSTPPETPANCCMSGCANCVWLDYAEEVTQFYRQRGQAIPHEDIIREIETNLSDPMIKAFVLLELKTKIK